MRLEGRGQEGSNSQVKQVEPDGRIARLERQGVFRRPVAAASKTTLSTRPPRPRKGRKASDIVIDDRRQAR
jgi:hypothetical protein